MHIVWFGEEVTGCVKAVVCVCVGGVNGTADQEYWKVWERRVWSIAIFQVRSIICGRLLKWVSASQLMAVSTFLYCTLSKMFAVNNSKRLWVTHNVSNAGASWAVASLLKTFHLDSVSLYWHLWLGCPSNQPAFLPFGLDGTLLQIALPFFRCSPGLPWQFFSKPLGNTILWLFKM